MSGVVWIKRRHALILLLVTIVALGSGASRTAASPSNDDFVNATVLAAAGSTLTADTTGATKQTGEPNHAGDQGGASVWYSWTPDFTGTASIDTNGSSIDTLLAAYTGTDVTLLTRIASSDDVNHPGHTSRVCFPVSANTTTYRIAVDGYNGAAGAITLTWGPKADAAPCPTLPPQISGPSAPKVGDQLSWVGGTYADGGITPSLQWLHCVEQLCHAIEGASGATYTVTESDVGTAILVDEQLTNAGGTATSLSDPTNVVSLVPQTHANGRIFWVSKVVTQSSPGAFRIDSELPDGSSRQFLTAALNPGWSTMPAPSPDGRFLAFVNFGNGNHIELMNADGSGVVDLGVVGTYPAWSPSGSRIAFVSSNGIETIDDDGNQIVIWPFAFPAMRTTTSRSRRPTGAVRSPS
jgi:hypothetical protein